MRLSVLGRASVVLAAALLVPACSTQKRKDPPILVATSPTPGQAGIPSSPNIFLRFDRALDPSTVTGSVELINSLSQPMGITVTYNPGLFEIRIVPTSALADPLDTSTKDYQVNIFSTLKSSEGVLLGQNLFFQFHVPVSADKTAPVFGGATSVDQPATSQTQLTLNWNAATDNAFSQYRIYMATSPGGEDLLAAPWATANTGTSTAVTGLLAGTTYYFVIKAIDASGNLDNQFAEVSGTTMP